MRPRQQVIAMFSTFVRFESDRFSSWVTDVKLRRNIQQYLERSPDGSASESFWSLYWHKCWQAEAEALARLHLLAYLQEPCYWAAEQTVKKFTTTQYGTADYFQMALAEADSVLKGFNADRGARLKTYASMAFLSLLRDILRQRYEVDLCTHGSLLRKVSKKRLIEALQHTGLSAVTIGQYRLAWTCFKTLYVPTSPDGTLPKLNPDLWQAVAQRYNTEQQQLMPAGVGCDAETMERWLIHCAVLIRHYLYPPIDSLNLPKPGQEIGEIQDSLSDPKSESPLAIILAQEEFHQRQSQHAQIYTILFTALTQLDRQSQTLMRLYYQEGLTQQQMMQQLQISQATISRRLTKSRELLLTALLQWSQPELNSPVTPTLIRDISTVLEEWLVAYYSRADRV